MTMSACSPLSNKLGSSENLGSKIGSVCSYFLAKSAGRPTVHSLLVSAMLVNVV